MQTAGVTTNDAIMPMVTSYGSMNPVDYFTSQYNVQSYKFPKDKVLSEQSDSTVTSD